MRVMIAALAGLLALGACSDSGAGNDTAFGQRVRAYLLAHPEVLQEAARRLDAREAAQDIAAQKAGAAKLPALRAALERDPKDFVANPGGTVTVTEFYDYRCPHCISAAPKVLALIRSDPKVRFVFKESPIFGATSDYAARAALAVKARGGDYLGFYRDLMASEPVNVESVNQIAHRYGVDHIPETVPHLAENADLFAKLALGGTPAFIIGDTIVYGEDMDAVGAAIRKAEQAKST